MSDDKVLLYLKSYIANNGRAPSYREIKAACNIPSLSGIGEILATLEARGEIVRKRGTSRGITIPTETAAYWKEKWLVEKSRADRLEGEIAFYRRQK